MTDHERETHCHLLFRCSVNWSNKISRGTCLANRRIVRDRSSGLVDSCCKAYRERNREVSKTAAQLDILYSLRSDTWKRVFVCVIPPPSRRTRKNQ